MNTNEILKEFAERFVEQHFRERFLHEAKKKPQNLHTRICHEIEKIFNSKFRGSQISYKPEDQCLMLSGHKIEETTWALAEKHMGLGNGLLIIDVKGRKFYAETEAEFHNPSKNYGGQS